MTKTITITTEDLDAAIAVPWSTCSCIVAQALTRHFGRPVGCHGTAAVTDKLRFRYHAKLIMEVFDTQFGGKGPRNREAVAKLLPHTLEVEIIDRLWHEHPHPIHPASPSLPFPT